MGSYEQFTNNLSNNANTLSEVTKNLQLKNIYFEKNQDKNIFDNGLIKIMNIIQSILAWVFLTIFILSPHEYEPARNFIYLFLFLLFYIISFLDQLVYVPEFDCLEKYVKFIKIDEFHTFFKSIISSEVNTCIKENKRGKKKIKHLYSIDISGNFIIPENFIYYYFQFNDSIELYYKEGIYCDFEFLLDIKYRYYVLSDHSKWNIKLFLSLFTLTGLIFYNRKAPPSLYYYKLKKIIKFDNDDITTDSEKEANKLKPFYYINNHKYSINNIYHYPSNWEKEIEQTERYERLKEEQRLEEEKQRKEREERQKKEERETMVLYKFLHREIRFYVLYNYLQKEVIIKYDGRNTGYNEIILPKGYNTNTDEIIRPFGNFANNNYRHSIAVRYLDTPIILCEYGNAHISIQIEGILNIYV